MQGTLFCDFGLHRVEQVLNFALHIRGNGKGSENSNVQQCRQLMLRGYKILCFGANPQKYQTLVPAKNSHHLLRETTDTIILQCTTQLGKSSSEEKFCQFHHLLSCNGKNTCQKVYSTKIFSFLSVYYIYSSSNYHFDSNYLLQCLLNLMQEININGVSQCSD